MSAGKDFSRNVHLYVYATLTLYNDIVTKLSLFLSFHFLCNFPEYKKKSFSYSYLSKLKIAVTAAEWGSRSE